MTLGDLARMLQSVAAAGHPVELQTPDGKRWEAYEVVQTWKAPEKTKDNINTVVLLKELK